MQLPTQPYKGARDFYPEDKRLQKYVFNKWRTIVERFGYEEYDAPILEPLELYKAKTGDEIVNEQTYNFKDRGGREVAIRPEMTPSVSRMVAARRQQLFYPLRWYSIPSLWRYERPQRGRLREHWQLNVDLFGLDSLAAEHEIIQVANELMKSFGAQPKQYVIKLNSRKLMQAALKDYLGLSKDQAATFSKLIDRKHKMPEDEFKKAAEAIFKLTGAKTGSSQKFFNFLETKSLTDLPSELKAEPSWNELHELMNMLEASGITNAVYDVTLMRGLDYYTDIVFEMFDVKPENNRALFGGGRYDGLIALFGVEPIPTVGFGMGDVALGNFLESNKLLPKLTTETDLYAILIGNVHMQAGHIVDQLRAKGINVAVDPSGRKADKQIKNAVKKGIRYALFIGQKELEAKKFNLKNLSTGKESAQSLNQIAKTVHNYRAKS